VFGDNITDMNNVLSSQIDKHAIKKYFPHLYECLSYYALCPSKKWIVPNSKLSYASCILVYLNMYIKRQHNYFESVDNVSKNLINRVIIGKPHYEFTDGNLYDGYIDWVEVETEMASLCQSLSLSIESLIEHIDWFDIDQCFDRMIEMCKNVIYTYDKENIDMSSYEFVEIMFAKEFIVHIHELRTMYDLVDKLNTLK